MDPVEDTTSARLLDRAPLMKVVRDLSVLREWRAVWAIAVQWIVVGLAMAIAIRWPHWAVYLAAVVVIGSRQHAMGVLVHEAAHYRLFRRRGWNDVVSDLFLAFPSAISTSVYRRLHFDHHKFVNSLGDPNIQFVAGDEAWLWPKLPWECAKLFALDLVGLNCKYIAQVMWSWSPWPHMFPRLGTRWPLSPGERFRVVAYTVGFLVAMTLVGWWKFLFLFWVVPGCTVLTFINRARNLAEYYGLENQHELNASRHVRPQWWERLLLAPCHINYHLAHHLFPSVPFYNLPKLHAHLLRQEEFQAHAHLTQSYTGAARGVLAELLKRTPSASPPTMTGEVERGM